MKEPTRDDVMALLSDAGHAINANDGRCPLIEDVLCRTTTLCVQVLDRMDADAAKENPRCA
jgi:hypothetical protein